MNPKISIPVLWFVDVASVSTQRSTDKIIGRLLLRQTMVVYCWFGKGMGGHTHIFLYQHRMFPNPSGEKVKLSVAQTPTAKATDSTDTLS